jgi:hypothetical protein
MAHLNFANAAAQPDFAAINDAAAQIVAHLDRD